MSCVITNVNGRILKDVGNWLYIEIVPSQVLNDGFHVWIIGEQIWLVHLRGRESRQLWQPELDVLWREWLALTS
jgi:hypothetical protein